MGEALFGRIYVLRSEYERFAARVEDALEDFNERIENMATQQDVDQITSQVNQVAVDLGSTRTALQAEIDRLAQANPGVDVSALQAAVEPLDGAVQALGQLQPAPPAA